MPSADLIQFFYYTNKPKEKLKEELKDSLRTLWNKVNPCPHLLQRNLRNLYHLRQLRNLFERVKSINQGTNQKVKSIKI